MRIVTRITEDGHEKQLRVFLKQYDFRMNNRSNYYIVRQI